ncbi:MAG: DUF433 domain-containing protein [Planctomycetes bacterium]|nr:DUF433 domain-containing protein [Planctomycetota bacterium]
MGMSYIGHGVYSFPEAARLLKLPVATLRTWLLGVPGREPVTPGDYLQTRHDQKILSFLDVMDTFIIKGLREYKVSLQYLRKVRDALAHDLSTEHPFSSRRLLTDGRQVFIHFADEFGGEKLKEVLTRQHAFPSVLVPYLKQIAHDERTDLARCWNISRGVVIDPTRAFGKPIVASTGIPTGILAAAFEANDEDAELVADWYGVDVQEVRHAVAFEESLKEATAA